MSYGVCMSGPVINRASLFAARKAGIALVQKTVQNAQADDAQRLKNSVAVLIAKSIFNPRGLFAMPKKPTPVATNNTTPTLKR